MATDGVCATATDGVCDMAIDAVCAMATDGVCGMVTDFCRAVCPLLRFLATHLVVPGAGIEPARPHGHWILSPARLPIPPSRHKVLCEYGTTASLRLHDGAVMVCRRSRSARYQCRFRLPSGRWLRVSTGCVSLEDAIAAACVRYDEARFRQLLGITPITEPTARVAALVAASSVS